MRSSPAPPRSPRHIIVPDAGAPERAGLTAFFSSKERKGEWSLPRHLRIACILGATTVDLREARIPAGVSQIEIFCLAGSVEVMVPQGVQVEIETDGVMASIEFHPDTTVPTPLDAPVLRLTGNVHVGSLEVRVQLAGETARETRKRLKRAR